MTKLIAPAYYTGFCCIADKCRHSCCIGWEIDIDGDTVQKYTSLPADCGRKITDSIDMTDTPHFRLAENDRCPHLTDGGLCRIILEHGETYLCEICREHPRFYNTVPDGQEVGIGMSCEEACRIILSSDSYGTYVEIGNAQASAEPGDFDPRIRRREIYAVLSDRSLPYPERLRRLYADSGVSPAVLTDAQWQSLLDSLEYLEEGHRQLFSSYTSDPATAAALEKPLERALAYFVYRHCTSARSPGEFRTSLGLCLFLERLLSSMAGQTASIEDAARILSEEIEYSEENTDAIRWEFAFGIL